MLHQTSVSRLLAVIALAFVITIAVTSCGSQKMGCPGSITQSEKPAASHS
ncbi:MAG: hypothetical protein K1X61_14850 [Chitinophagales bacterium]|nr:hypothetical protein [Chitinophagales bacterium]